MKLDAGRKFDLEELNEARQKAPNRFWRDHYEKKMYGVLAENGNVRSLREKLIGAIRHNDRREVAKVQHEIQRINLNKTYGRQDY